MPVDFQPLIAKLSSCGRILLTTHVRPDGDAVGTVAALHLGLRHRGIASDILLLSHLPGKYAFVFNDASIPHIDAEAGWPANLKLEDYDGLLVCDTGTWSQLPGLRQALDGWTGIKMVLDHHLTQEDWADVRVVDSTAAAAGELAMGLLRDWSVPFSSPIATALFVAIVSDTGWFQFSNTTARTFRAAAELVEQGVDTDRIQKLLNQSERRQRLLIQARAMGGLQFFRDGEIAVMTIAASDFAATGAKVTDTENLINIPLQAGSVEVSLLLTEPPEGGPVRASLRSKGRLDCARFAEQFGGGGHARAAGMKLEGNLDDARSRLVQALEVALPAGAGV
jgi:phosphoesterase RecJ-like protein